MVRRRVLLVGGGRQLGAICSEYFRLRLGDNCEVESIEYCDDALEALSRQRFDLMLLFSIHAQWRTRPPVRFTGIELLKQMVARNLRVPVLVISASLRRDAKIAAFANGAFGFISWPLDLAELDKALQRVLSPSSHASG